VSFELRPQRPDFSRQGFFGLGLIGRPQLQVQSNPTGVDAARTGLNDGFSYSAGLRVDTGLDTTSPLWLLSLQGNVDLQDLDEGDDQGLQPNWFLNPSLFWEQPGFTFSAEMQVPVSPLIDDTVTDQPDYRLRAVFEKHFR